MTDAPDSPRTGDLSVLDAWRVLAKPAPTRPASSYVGLALIVALMNLSAVAVLVAVAAPNPIVAIVAALIHTGLIPGLLLAFATVPPDEVDAVEWLLLAVGLGTLVLVVGGVVLALLPTRFTPIAVVGWTCLLTLVLSVFAFRRGVSWRVPASGGRANAIGAALVLVAAAGLRLPGLGYSEFQGDETEVILRATGVVQNLPDALFYHGKGPGEVVVVALQYGLLGWLSEGGARLPFALAGVAGVGVVYALARRLFGPGAGAVGAIAVGLLLAANGYFLAFSRITQYQSLVLLLGALGLWCTVRWSQGGSNVWPVLAGALMATAALAHYDALFFLPPIGLAILWRIGWRGLFDHGQLAPWFRGAQVGIVILALFFVPYVDSPLFALATGRISDRVGVGQIQNNLPSIVASATLYLGTAFPLLVGATIVAGGLAQVARRAGAPPRAAWLLGAIWAVVPLLFYAFEARKPGTHIHVATTGLVFLAGAGFGSLWYRLAAPSLRIALAAGSVAAFGLVLAYLVPIYLLTTAETVREDRVDALPLTWRPPGGLPTKERFGFPYQAGWRTIGALYADGTLVGSYDSNEQPQVTHWYTRGSWRCSATPRYYFIAENVQDEIDTPARLGSSGYHQIGAISVAGEPKLRVFERGPSTGTRPVLWRTEELGPIFDRQLSTPTLDPGTWARGVVARGSTAVNARFGDDADLLGYQLFAEDPRPGGVVRVDLFWLPHVDSRERHRIDVQLGRDPRIGDGGGPACDKTGEEKEWTVGRPFTQRVSIPIAASAAPGSYPLLVSVAQLGGGGPLQPGGSGATDDVLLEIGQVEVGDAHRAAR